MRIENLTTTQKQNICYMVTAYVCSLQGLSLEAIRKGLRFKETLAARNEAISLINDLLPYEYRAQADFFNLSESTIINIINTNISNPKALETLRKILNK